jgi:hypothetical protein
MPKATCQCGQVLKIPKEGPDRIVCPNCKANIRIRRGGLQGLPPDGYIRFSCPCGRRLKVLADRPPKTGQCPDCGRIVPVPSKAEVMAKSSSDPETPTGELSAAERAQLEAWIRRHGKRGQPGLPQNRNASSTAIQPAPPTGRVEAGLRICPRCGKPVHLGAKACPECGTPVPKR